VIEGTRKIMDRLLTQAEVAEYVRRPIATVRYWRFRGNIGPKGANIAGRVMYREADVQRWIDEQFQAELAAADRDTAAAGA
jgi:DNA-binding transcriptional MerR regulator